MSRKPQTPMARAYVELEGEPESPQMLPFTFAELDYLLKVASEVTMKHKLFTLLGFDWEVSPQLPQLFIVVRGRVPDRDAPSTYDAESYDIETGLVYDRAPTRRWDEDGMFGTGLSALVTLPQRRHQPLVPIVSRIPVQVDRALLADRDALVQHLTRAARSALVYACTHEIDEMLLIDGRRATEPHEEFAFKVKV